MGQDLYEHSPAARSVLDRVVAMEGLGHIAELCFNGPEELLTRTDNVQPAITAVSMMALAAIREASPEVENNRIPVACAGHSLGEYAAHAAAGNLSLDLVMELVKWRGFWMNEASQPPNPRGSMLAVMGLSVGILEKIVATTGTDRIAIANINSSAQTILSGERDAVETASKLAVEAGAKRCVPLKVSGAWHSPLMKTAHQKMGELLERRITSEMVVLSDHTAVVANVTGDVVTDIESLRDTLTRQVTSPVKWVDCVRRLVEIAGYPGLPKEIQEEDRGKLEHLPTFIEVGPGKVLKGLLKNIDRNLHVVNVEDSAGISEAASLLN